MEHQPDKHTYTHERHTNSHVFALFHTQNECIRLYVCACMIKCTAAAQNTKQAQQKKHTQRIFTINKIHKMLKFKRHRLHLLLLHKLNG